LKKGGIPGDARGPAVGYSFCASSEGETIRSSTSTPELDLMTCRQ
jgi:hypothetical protein